MSRRKLPFLLGVLACAAGCEGLKARHRASLGAELYKKGDYQNALYKFEQAAQLDPNIDALHSNLAFTYLQLFHASPKSATGKAYGGLAVKSFEEYLRRRPPTDESAQKARDYLIATFVDTQRYDDAVAFFKPEVERPRPNLEAIFTLGQIAAKTGRIQEAFNWYQKRIDMAPNDPDGPYNFGVLVWDHLRNHPEVAGNDRMALADRGLAALRKSMEMRSKDPNGFIYANLLYRERSAGQPDDVTKAADIAEADRFKKQAEDLLKSGSK